MRTQLLSLIVAILLVALPSVGAAAPTPVPTPPAPKRASSPVETKHTPSKPSTPTPAGAYSVSGEVFEDADEDGRRGPNEAGLADVEIRLTGSALLSRTARTDERGRYTFDKLRAGTYQVALALDDVGTPTTAASFEVSIPRDRPGPYAFGVVYPALPAADPVEEETSAPEASEAAAPEVAEEDEPATPEAVQEHELPAPEAAERGEPAARAVASEGEPAARDAASEDEPAEPEVAAEDELAALEAAIKDVQAPPPGEQRKGDVAADDALLRAMAVDASPRPVEPAPVTVLRFAPGRDVAAQLGRRAAPNGGLWLGVPFKTQADGSPFQLVNCGPASLSMVLAAFGLDVTPSGVRDYLNWRIGNYDTSAGTSLEQLSAVARQAGLVPLDLYEGVSGFRTWSTEAIRWHVEQGHPVITLVKYRSLPGRQQVATDFDHYVVIMGLTAEGFIFNDPALSGQAGYGLAISPRELEAAWESSSIPRQAMAMALPKDGAGLTFPGIRVSAVEPTEGDDWARRAAGQSPEGAPTALSRRTGDDWPWSAQAQGVLDAAAAPPDDSAWMGRLLAERPAGVQDAVEAAAQVRDSEPEAVAEVVAAEAAEDRAVADGLAALPAPETEIASRQPGSWRVSPLTVVTTLALALVAVGPLLVERRSHAA